MTDGTHQVLIANIDDFALLLGQCPKSLHILHMANSPVVAVGHSPSEGRTAENNEAKVPEYLFHCALTTGGLGGAPGPDTPTGRGTAKPNLALAYQTRL